MPWTVLQRSLVGRVDGAEAVGLRTGTNVSQILFWKAPERGPRTYGGKEEGRRAEGRARRGFGTDVVGGAAKSGARQQDG